MVRQKKDKDATAARRADESDETREARQKQNKDDSYGRAMAKDGLVLELEEMDSYSHNPHEKEGPVRFCLCAYCYLKYG